MNSTSSTESIAHLLASDPPRSKSLLMTIFGDAIVPHGGMVWLGSLIDLLAPLGVNDRLLRTSVFRLAQEGWLGARRDGRGRAHQQRHVRRAAPLQPRHDSRCQETRRRRAMPVLDHLEIRHGQPLFLQGQSVAPDAGKINAGKRCGTRAALRPCPVKR